MMNSNTFKISVIILRYINNWSQNIDKLSHQSFYYILLDNNLRKFDSQNLDKYFFFKSYWWKLYFTAFVWVLRTRGWLTGSCCSFDQSQHEASSRMESAERSCWDFPSALFVATLALSLSYLATLFRIVCAHRIDDGLSFYYGTHEQRVICVTFPGGSYRLKCVKLISCFGHLPGCRSIKWQLSPHLAAFS